MSAIIDRKKRGEAGMSVLKHKMKQLNQITADRQNRLLIDRDGIQLIPDFGVKDATITLSPSSGNHRTGMRERLNTTQIQRGRELRRLEKRKKNRFSDDDQSIQQTNDESKESELYASTSESTNHHESRPEDTEQSFNHSTDLLYSLQHEDDQATSPTIHQTGSRRREKGDPASLKASLDAIQINGQSASHRRASNPNLTLGTLLQRQRRQSHNQTITQFNPATISRPHSTHISSNPNNQSINHTSAHHHHQSETFSTLPVSVHDIKWKPDPPIQLPVKEAMQLVFATVDWSQFKARATHFSMIWSADITVKLAEDLFWHAFIHSFQQTNSPADNSSNVADLDRLKNSILQSHTDLTYILNQTLKFPAHDHESLTSLLERPIDQNAHIASGVIRTGLDAIKDRFLTATPIVLNSIIFALMSSSFSLSAHLFTPHFLTCLDIDHFRLMSGFQPTELSAKRWRSEFITAELQTHQAVGSLRPLIEYDEALRSKLANTNSVTSSMMSSPFSSGDWAEDERERREQAKRKHVSDRQSGEYSHSKLSPYEQQLLQELDDRRAGRGHQPTKQKCNVNSLSPLLSVGLDRTTPDASWRKEHILRYVIPSSASQLNQGESKEQAVIKVNSERDDERILEYQAMKEIANRMTTTVVKRRALATASTLVPARRGSVTLTTSASTATLKLDDAKRVEKLSEGDPLNVLTARTRRLILQYSQKSMVVDDEAHPNEQEGARSVNHSQDAE